jgi:hypothetical protein
MANDNYDPWQAAEEAKELPKTYFAQVTLDVWPCVLEKGVGKVPFDPNAHKEGQRRTAIQLTLTPLPSANVDFVTERGYVDFAREWASITLPSIKILGVNLRELHEKWVKYEMVKYGTYTKKGTDGEEGEEKDLTTPRFLALYASEEEAEAAASEFYGNGGDSEPAPINNGERDVALKFLPALVAQVGGDPTKLAEVIASNSLVSKYFDINSPEVVELLTEKVF